MAGFAFSNRKDIERVLRLVETEPGRKPKPSIGTSEHSKIFATGVICQTPVGGIAARSGTTVTSASCPVYYIDGSTLTAFNESIDVYNLAGAAVAGSTYITAKLVGTNWVADMEDCG